MQGSRGEQFGKASKDGGGRRAGSGGRSKDKLAGPIMLLIRDSDVSKFLEQLGSARKGRKASALSTEWDEGFQPPLISQLHEEALTGADLS